jgi:glycosyltransferase involved in cell wall biosynthesis
MKKNIKIACLPVAGIGNPYQYLMIEGLNSGTKINAVSGIDDRFFGILRTAIKIKPTYIHFDWITSYYYRRSLWMTILSIPIFMIQLLIVRYILNIKLVWTLHNIQPHDSNHNKIHAFCRRFFAKQCTWIRIFSEDSLHRAQKALNIINKFKVVPEGSYVDYYKNTLNMEEARSRLGLQLDNFVFLYLGSIKPYKGIENLLDSFKILNIENSKLIVAGKSFNLDYLKSLNFDQPRVQFRDDFIPDDELEQYFNAANVVVLPFNNVENSGSVILAMGFKKPIIAPKIGVVKKRLKNQQDLLYTNDLDFQQIMKETLSRNDLSEIGSINFKELQRYQWSDFSNCFR